MGPEVYLPTELPVAFTSRTAGSHTLYHIVIVIIIRGHKHDHPHDRDHQHGHHDHLHAQLAATHSNQFVITIIMIYGHEHDHDHQHGLNDHLHLNRMLNKPVLGQYGKTLA